MKFNKLTVALLLTGAVSMNANATNLLDGIGAVIDGVGKVANTILTIPESVGQVTSSTNGTTANTAKMTGDVLTLLSYYKDVQPSSKFGVSRQSNDVQLVATGCSTSSFDVMTEQFNRYTKGGDLDMAQYQLEGMVSSFADCALIASEGKHKIPSGSSKETYVFKTGQHLSLLARMTTKKKQKDDAIKFLQWSGLDVSGVEEAKLNEAFGLGAVNKSGLAMKFSAKQVVAEKEANSRAFDKKYLGKQLAVTGKIDRIHGDEDYVYVTMRGTGKDNANDVIHCKITNKDEMDKSDRFATGQKVTVYGTYEVIGLGIGVDLNNCAIK